MLSGTPNAPSLECNVPKDQDLESHLHPLETVEVVLEIVKALHPEFITTSCDLYIFNLLQQQDLSAHPWPQTQQQVALASEA